jgi:hypothetical protein
MSILTFLNATRARKRLFLPFCVRFIYYSSTTLRFPGLYLSANIPAGSNKANGIIPHKLVMAVAMTPITNKIIPTALVLFLTANVIGINPMYMKNDRNRPATKGAVLANVWSNSRLACCVSGLVGSIDSLVFRNTSPVPNSRPPSPIRPKVRKMPIIQPIKESV